MALTSRPNRGKTIGCEHPLFPEGRWNVPVMTGAVFPEERRWVPKVSMLGSQSVPYVSKEWRIFRSAGQE